MNLHPNRSDWPQSLVSIDQLERKHHEQIFKKTDEALHDLVKNMRRPSLRYHTIALLFQEPSTRTRVSFWSAVEQLDGRVVYNGNGSLSKGETVADTLRVIAGYADLVVLRQAKGDTDVLAAMEGMPGIINAGDGANEHPTQALIDLYTIQRRYGRLDNLTVAVGFDPGHSRSIRSFCRALSQYEGNEVVMVAPDEAQMSDDECNRLMDAGLKVTQSDQIATMLDCEIVYINRFQKERWADYDLAEKLSGRFQLDAAKVKTSAIKHILDPLPRNGEMNIDLDELDAACYFEQANYGLPVRMGVLELFVPEPRTYWRTKYGKEFGEPS